MYDIENMKCRGIDINELKSKLNDFYKELNDKEDIKTLAITAARAINDRSEMTDKEFKKEMATIGGKMGSFTKNFKKGVKIIILYHLISHFKNKSLIKDVDITAPAIQRFMMLNENIFFNKTFNTSFLYERFSREAKQGVVGWDGNIEICDEEGFILEKFIHRILASFQEKNRQQYMFYFEKEKEKLNK